MAIKVYITGTLYDKEDAKISVFDHGLLYGIGVFEGIRSYGGRLFMLEEHIHRLWDSAKAIWLNIPCTKEEMCDTVYMTLRANEIQDGYVRLIVTQGAGTLGLDPTECSNPQIIVIADRITLYPPEYYEEGLELVTVSVQRNHPAAISPRIKSLNYLNNILAKIEGMQAGCIEALMLNHKGEVAECTGDNIFTVRGGCLLTPPIDAGILEGITRDVVIDMAEEMEIEVGEIPLTKHDIYIADEVFLTGTAAEIVPVVKVDSRQIGDGRPGPMTRALMEEFHEVVRRYGEEESDDSSTDTDESDKSDKSGE